MNNKLLILLVIFVVVILFLVLNIDITGPIIIDKSLNLIDILSLIVNTVLILLIPTIITKSIEDNKNIKQLIADDIEKLIFVVSKNSKIISGISSGSEPAQLMKEEITDIFAEAEMLIDEILLQVEISFPEKVECLDSLKDSFFEYKNLLTDNPFTKNGFKMDYSFHEKNKMLFTDLRKKMKASIHDVFKY